MQRIYLYFKTLEQHGLHSGQGLERCSTSVLDSLQSFLANSSSTILIDIFQVLQRPLVLAQLCSDKLAILYTGIGIAEEVGCGYTCSLNS
jgi:hypothetical protein